MGKTSNIMTHRNKRAVRGRCVIVLIALIVGLGAFITTKALMFPDSVVGTYANADTTIRLTDCTRVSSYKASPLCVYFGTYTMNKSYSENSVSGKFYIFTSLFGNNMMLMTEESENGVRLDVGSVPWMYMFHFDTAHNMITSDGDRLERQ